MVKRIIFLLLVVQLSAFSVVHERAKIDSDCKQWKAFYLENSSEVDSLAFCVFGSIKKRVIGTASCNGKENYATLFISGILSDFASLDGSSTLKMKDSVISDILNSLQYQRKNHSTNFDLSEISWGWTGFDVIYSDDSIIAVRVHGDGEFRVSDDFTSILKMCAKKQSIETKTEYLQR